MSYKKLLAIVVSVLSTIAGFVYLVMVEANPPLDLNNNTCLIRESEFVENLRYAYDTRAGLCFARVRNGSWFSVPCTKELIVLTSGCIK